MVKKSYVREVINKHMAVQTTLQRLMDEKVVVKAKMRDIKVAYVMLKNNMRGQVLQLGSTEKKTIFGL
jgi:hypothetical protein